MVSGDLVSPFLAVIILNSKIEHPEVALYESSAYSLLFNLVFLASKLFTEGSIVSIEDR